MTRNTSAVAVCCAIASSRSAVRSSSCRRSSAIIFRGSAELTYDLIKTVINLPIDHSGTVVAPIGLYKRGCEDRERLLLGALSCGRRNDRHRRYLAIDPQVEDSRLSAPSKPFRSRHFGLLGVINGNRGMCL